MKAIEILLILAFLFSQNAWAGEPKARAYLVDGGNGTRSGPIRQTKEQEKLEKDRQYLIKNAQSNERSSGIASPGDKFWTDLPVDSIFKIRKE